MQGNRVVTFSLPSGGNVELRLKGEDSDLAIVAQALKCPETSRLLEEIRADLGKRGIICRTESTGKHIFTEFTDSGEKRMVHRPILEVVASVFRNRIDSMRRRSPQVRPA